MNLTEGLSATGRRQAAVSLTPDGDRIHVHIFRLKVHMQEAYYIIKRGQTQAVPRLLPFFLLSAQEELPVLEVRMKA